MPGIIPQSGRLVWASSDLLAHGVGCAQFEGSTRRGVTPLRIVVGTRRLQCGSNNMLPSLSSSCPPGFCQSPRGAGLADPSLRERGKCARLALCPDPLARGDPVSVWGEAVLVLDGDRALPGQRGGETSASQDWAMLCPPAPGSRAVLCSQALCPGSWSWGLRSSRPQINTKPPPQGGERCSWVALMSLNMCGGGM